jgi:hypothetical protein
MAEGMAEDYENMEDDYHPSDGNNWEPFDPNYHFQRILNSAEFAGSNTNDERMELDFSQYDLIKWEQLNRIINDTIEALS